MHLGQNIIKYWKYYAVVTAMVTLGTWIYNQGSSDSELDNRIFSTKEMKYETEKYMKQKPSPAQEQKAYFRDSINKVSAIKSRAMRDSIYKEEIMARRKSDSINMLNADQLYQIKEQLRLLLPDTINN